MIVGDPLKHACIVCGALEYEECHGFDGEILGFTHSQRARPLDDRPDWIRKYDALYRVMPEGGFFGGKHHG